MNCIICGKEIPYSSYSSAVLCGRDCFDKNFWNEIIEEKEEHFFIDGQSYCVEKENEFLSDNLKGFGGAKFYIKLENGEVITTTNLWCQGIIPKEYRDILKDNARFIRLDKDGWEIL